MVFDWIGITYVKRTFVKVVISQFVGMSLVKKEAQEDGSWSPCGELLACRPNHVRSSCIVPRKSLGTEQYTQNFITENHNMDKVVSTTVNNVHDNTCWKLRATAALFACSCTLSLTVRQFLIAFIITFLFFT